jgi:hypothetical protein
MRALGWLAAGLILAGIGIGLVSAAALTHPRHYSKSAVLPAKGVDGKVYTVDMASLEARSSGTNRDDIRYVGYGLIVVGVFGSAASLRPRRRPGPR